MTVDWREQAACRGADPNLFFPQKWDQVSRDHAKRICAGCQSLEPCRDEAIVNGETVGVWGGLSGAELRNAVRTRPPRPPAVEHGTWRGYVWHGRSGVPLCGQCRIAGILFREPDRATRRARRAAKRGAA